MIVAELIKRLSEVDENLEVQVYASYDAGFGGAGGEIQEITYEDGVILLNNYNG